MLKSFSKRRTHVRNAHQIYGSIVTMTRMPALYTRIGVPDTLEARFELLMLHMYLVVHWLNGIDGDNKKLKQALVDNFFEDAETVSRQVGVGDLSVPKKMRQLAGMFGARMNAYQAASDKNGDKAMQTLILENFFANVPEHARASAALTAYANGLQARFASRSIEWMLENMEGIAHLETADNA